ncbi:hypothetical protein L7F22_056614 [Adiantum nelumboides]|nr:hypothetical protein [Adiantum nelumboides]
MVDNNKENRMSIDYFDFAREDANDDTPMLAALILHANGTAITVDKILTLLKAANGSIELYWPSLFANLLEKRNVKDLITCVGFGGGGAIVVATGGNLAPGRGASAPPLAEEKKEEPKEESNKNMGFNLVD